AKLPATVDQAKLKKSFFEILIAVGSISYNPEAAQLEAIRTNADFRATLQTIATAGGITKLTIDDFLMLIFGDGGDIRGVEGTVRDLVAGMNAKELANLLSSNKGLDTVKSSALAAVLADKKVYSLSKVLNNLGVKPANIASMLLTFNKKLEHEEKAITALDIAYIRTVTEVTVKITEDGRQHLYGLTLLGKELPSSSLKWKKLSGSKDVTVDSTGKVSLSKRVQKGTAVIQATLVHAFGGSPRVVYEQEVTLVAGILPDPETEVQDILKLLQVTLTDIKARLNGTTSVVEKAQLIVEVAQAGNDSFEQIKDTDATKAIKDKAINHGKDQVKQTISLIILKLLNY
ncbi:MAG: hypothetical protein K6T85_18540, partial [Gorillibacterium sp.]|nr:hypothetical protein [Gorillibacterium sp.]